MNQVLGPKRMLFWLSEVTLGYFCYKRLRLPDHSPLVGILGLVGLAIFVLFVKYGATFLSARTFVKKNPDKLGPANTRSARTGLPAIKVVLAALSE